MNDNTIPIITIDGPSGTGKGTLCYLLAKHLNWNMLDSGAIYRVLAYAAKKKTISLEDLDQLSHLALNLNLYFEPVANHQTKVILDNEDVTETIRSEESSQAASKIAAIQVVREALLARQRSFARAPGLVTDGRDMGTVVFPEASFKLFLYASAEERANRRYLQLKDKQINVSLAQVVEELAKRDQRDTARSHAPLKAADDAVQIDTTGLSVDQVFSKVLGIIDKHLL